MQFDDKELDLILSKNVDKIIFESKGNGVMAVDLDRLVKRCIAKDPKLQKQLLAQALRSDD